MTQDLSLHPLRPTPNTGADPTTRASELLQARAAFDRQSRLPSPATVLSSHHASANHASPCPAWMPRGPIGECFRNALGVVMKIVADPRRANFKYAEGYVYHPKFDVLLEHAWIESPNGVVHDPTWEDTPDFVYLGLTFTHEEVLSAYMEAPESLLFGDWARGFPLLLSHAVCCAPLPPRRR